MLIKCIFFFFCEIFRDPVEFIKEKNKKKKKLLRKKKELNVYVRKYTVDVSA